MSALTINEWLMERRDNCLRIAKTKIGDDRDGWLEDAGYFMGALRLLAPHVEARSQEGIPHSEIVEIDDYVAWLRYTENGSIVTCDSDAPKAFRVYRKSR